MHGLQYFHSYEIGELLVETIKGSHKAEGEEQFSLNYLILAPRRTSAALRGGHGLLS